MKGSIAIVTDVHLANHRRFGGPVVSGINQRAKSILESLRWVVAFARAEKCEAILSLGDFFDSSHPSPQLIAAAQEITVESPPWFFLRGNHEMASDLPGDHSLSPLAPVGTVIDTVHREEIAGYEVGFVPFMPGRAEDHVAGAFAAEGPLAGVDLACIHAGVTDPKSAPFLRESVDAIEASRLFAHMAAGKIRQVAAGNYHAKRRWDAKDQVILQVGSLVPANFGEEGVEDYGWMAGLNSRGLRSISVPGIRFLKMKWPIVEFDRFSELIYVEIQAVAAHLEAARQWLESHIDQNHLAGGEVVLLRNQDDGKARAAIRGAADSVDQVVVDYVDEMRLPEGVQRARVLELVRGYLRG